MDKSIIKRKGRKCKLANMHEIKTVAKNLLQLDEDQFELEGIRSLKTQNIINKVIDKVTTKERDSHIAYLIEVCQGSSFPKINQENSKLEINQNLMKRKAVSPDARSIYSESDFNLLYIKKLP